MEEEDYTESETDYPDVFDVVTSVYEALDTGNDYEYYSDYYQYYDDNDDKDLDNIDAIRTTTESNKGDFNIVDSSIDSGSIQDNSSSNNKTIIESKGSVTPIDEYEHSSDNENHPDFYEYDDYYDQDINNLAAFGEMITETPANSDGVFNSGVNSTNIKESFTSTSTESIHEFKQSQDPDSVEEVDYSFESLDSSESFENDDIPEDLISDNTTVSGFSVKDLQANAASSTESIIHSTEPIDEDGKVQTILEFGNITNYEDKDNIPFLNDLNISLQLLPPPVDSLQKDIDEKSEVDSNERPENDEALFNTSHIKTVQDSFEVEQGVSGLFTSEEEDTVLHEVSTLEGSESIKISNSAHIKDSDPAETHSPRGQSVNIFTQCPGDTLKTCIEACQSLTNNLVYGVCVRECARRCP